MQTKDQNNIFSLVSVIMERIPSQAIAVKSAPQSPTAINLVDQRSYCKDL